jgi:hypothetical protein
LIKFPRVKYLKRKLKLELFKGKKYSKLKIPKKKESNKKVAKMSINVLVNKWKTKVTRFLLFV